MSAQNEQLLAFLVGLRTATACWLEGNGEAVELQHPADYEVLLSALTRYSATDHMTKMLAEDYRPVVANLCAALAAKVEEVSQNSEREA